MEEIEEFVNNLLILERDMTRESNKGNIHLSNEIRAELHSFCISDCPIGGQNITEPLSLIQKMKIEAAKIEAPVLERHFYKITEYKTENDNKLWACYVSHFPIKENTKDVKMLTNCFLVTLIDGQPKMVAEYFYDEYDRNRWKFGLGDEAYRHYYSLGNVVRIERYLKPSTDEGIDEYNKDR